MRVLHHIHQRSCSTLHLLHHTEVALLSKYSFVVGGSPLLLVVKVACSTVLFVHLHTHATLIKYMQSWQGLWSTILFSTMQLRFVNCELELLQSATTYSRFYQLQANNLCRRVNYTCFGLHVAAQCKRS